MRYDFGPVLVHQPGMMPARAALRVRNDDVQPISLSARPPVPDPAQPDDGGAGTWRALEVEGGQAMLSPGGSCEIGVVFRPTMPQMYKEVSAW